MIANEFRAAAARGDMVFLYGRVNEEVVMWRGILLVTAACNGQMEAVKYLLSLGARPIKQSFGCTVIQEVADCNFPEILKLLVETFPNEVSRMDFLGITPLHAAADNVRNAKILLDAGADPNACMILAAARPLCFAP